VRHPLRDYPIKFQNNVPPQIDEVNKTFLQFNVLVSEGKLVSSLTHRTTKTWVVGTTNGPLLSIKSRIKVIKPQIINNKMGNIEKYKGAHRKFSSPNNAFFLEA
jgi:hypothetical protein